MLQRLALLLILFVIPQQSHACERAFRSGLASFADADRRLRDTERALYSGLGWASRSAVLDRLEALSARTTACQEVDAQIDNLIRAARQLTRAEQNFRLARTLCILENQTRADQNLEALTDTARAVQVQRDYLDTLRDRC